MSFYLMFREDNIPLSIISFLLAGLIGLLSFNLPVKDPLLPLLSGLFGVSSLIVSLKSKTSAIPQKILKIEQIKMTKKETLKAIFASLFTPLFSFLPGIGSGHSALFSSELVPLERKGFLFLTGASSTVIMGLSFVTLYSINKTRSGTAVAVEQILKEITLSHLIVILGAIVLSGIIAFIVGSFLSKIFAKFISKINYKKLTISTIIILFIVNIIFSNLIGLIILLTSTFIGIFTIDSGSRRINLMGALIIPTIIYYLLT